MNDCPPVLLILFNRPELTKRVFDRIREVQPRQFFIAADGPRLNILADIDLCERSQKVVELVDWECEVQTLFRERNLGCKIGPSSAIDWLFEHVESGIILEDDCLPTLDFFLFCSELLEKYRNDSRVGMISGNNYGFNLYDENLSYSFSKHGFIWGWATWKRCWEKFDVDLDFLNANNIDLIKSNISTNSKFIDSWWEGVNAVLTKNLDAWDSQWGVTRYANNYLTIRPKVNLVANIGFGEEATHTFGKPKSVYSITGELEFPLVHPDIILPDLIADEMLEKFFLPTAFKKAKFPSRITRRIKDSISSYFTHLQVKK